MDTSETYIKMCDCPEIQGLVPEQETQTSSHFQFNEEGATIWLPHQDQIQAMMELDERHLMKGFREWLIWLTGRSYPKYPNGYYPRSMPYGIFLPTFEQMWLTFYMKEKHNKVWNGDKWVSIT